MDAQTFVDEYYKLEEEIAEKYDNNATPKYIQAVVKKLYYFGGRMKDFDLPLSEWQSASGKSSYLKIRVKRCGGEPQLLDNRRGVIENAKERQDKRIRQFREGYFEHDYNKYLKTEHWRELRETALFRDGHRCRMCNGFEYLSVHHRSYKNVWIPKKEIDDLTTVCEDCHENFHSTFDLIK